jgi:site-specific recombinase
MMPAPAGLPELLDTLDPGASRPHRHLWLIGLFDWIRAGVVGDAPQGAVSRVHLVLDAASVRPDFQPRWQRWWAQFTTDLDCALLLSDYGLAPRTAFLSALGDRLRRRLLPATPDTDDAGELLDLLLSDPRDAVWVAALDEATWQRITDLLRPSQSGAWGPQSLLDAVAFGVGQVAATGFAAEIRSRMAPAAREERPFLTLTRRHSHFTQVVGVHGVHSEAGREATEQLLAQLDRCQDAAGTVYQHLEEHGISVGIVFRVRQLRQRVRRIRLLLQVLGSERPAAAAGQLLTHLAMAARDRRSVRALIAENTQLTAAKVAERSAETGEHYITRNRTEYRHMLATAGGGGAVLAFTTWAKFAIYGLGLPAFWAGLGFGLNYAISFVIVMLLHWTVATKQPAVTAPAMAGKLRHMDAPDAVERFVDEMAHLLRSQVAAIAGNLGVVVPVVLVLCGALHVSGAGPMVDAEHAHHVLHEQSLLGPSALFAAFTGVLLFASSIIAGWTENAFVLHRLDSAITWNPRITRVLGGERAARWARWLRANVSGLAANVSLGLMLGLVPAFAAFFGLGLEVRHVTLSTGQVAAAMATLGLPALQTPEFWWAVAGLAIIGPLNLAVSFFLAFRVALAAHGITDIDRQRIYRAVRQRLRTEPASFLVPPPDASAPTRPSHG